jgi:hypothetical protein
MSTLAWTATKQPAPGQANSSKRAAIAEDSIRLPPDCALAHQPLHHGHIPYRHKTSETFYSEIIGENSFFMRKT